MQNPFISFNTNCSPKDERVRIEKAWEHFISGKKLDSQVRSLTYQSWERSLKHGIHPINGRSPISLSQEKINEYQSTSSLYSSLKPMLTKLKNAAIDSEHLIVFCNNHGEIVYLDGDSSLKWKAEKMNFTVGTSWSEPHIGTNAIGTSLATGTPMQVFAGEHYCQPVHNWVCSASPIRDPATKQILGVIDLTGLWKGIHPHSLSTVVSIAHSIEEKLQNQLVFEHFILLEHYSEISVKNQKKIVAVLDRGYQVIKAVPQFYENGWIDRHNYMNHLDYAAVPLGEKYQWEVELRKGRWTFELTPFFYQGYPIGSIVVATSISTQSGTAHVTKYSFSSLIGQSDKFQKVIAEARSVSDLKLPVLIEGESGTGKELLAQSIHSSSHYSSGPFIAVNCGAIQNELATSELFGYEDGTFTGGQKGGRSGKFQQAESGTIFLDEIGEMPLNLQTMLLRVLEEGEIVRLGGKKPIKLNVRVIAATNRDLKASTDAGEFRKDLYYRLNILSMHVPPLRERTGDIPLLLETLLRNVCMDIGRLQLNIDDQALRALENYQWPGNVRELRNFAYKMAAKVKGHIITSNDLPKEFLENKILDENRYHVNVNHHTEGQTLHNPSNRSPQRQEPVSINSSLKDQELQTILTTLNQLNGNVTETAKKLGIHRSTIYRKLERYSAQN